MKPLYHTVYLEEASGWDSRNFDVLKYENYFQVGPKGIFVFC
jgi:hypothetical protein